MSRLGAFFRHGNVEAQCSPPVALKHSRVYFPYRGATASFVLLLFRVFGAVDTDLPVP